MSQTLPERLESLRAILGEVEDPRLEIMRPRQAPDGWSKQPSISEEWRSYLFGVELIEEDDRHGLRRHILTGQKLVPASIEEACIRSKQHMTCRAHMFGSEETIRMICGRRPGLVSGAVVLVAEGGPGGRGGFRMKKPFDLLPGVAWSEVRDGSVEDGDSSQMLHVFRSNDSLLVQVRFPDGWRRLVIHNYSERLFSRGRRFVADLRKIDRNTAGRQAAEHRIPLKEICRNDGMILLVLRQPCDLFGRSTGLRACPALIDGEERYLVSACGVIDHREG